MSPAQLPSLLTALEEGQTSPFQCDNHKLPHMLPFSFSSSLRLFISFIPLLSFPPTSLFRRVTLISISKTTIPLSVAPATSSFSRYMRGFYVHIHGRVCLSPSARINVSRSNKEGAKCLARQALADADCAVNKSSLYSCSWRLCSPFFPLLFGPV